MGSILTLRDPAFLATVAAAGGGPADPPFIDTTDMTIWLKANAGTLLGGSPATDGGTVDTWENQISVTDAVQGTAGSRPTWHENVLNGRPVVRFDGTDDFMNFADGADVDMLGTCFFFFVMKCDDIVNQKALMAHDNDYGMGFSGTPFDGRGFFCQSTCSDSGGNLISVSTWHLIYFESTAVSRGDIYFDNVLVGNALIGGPVASGSVATLAAVTGGAGLNFQGDIAEMGLWSRNLSSTERDDLAAYVLAKYGV